MNRDDVIRWAREAGMEQDGDNFFSPSHEEIDVHITDLERFAALVAAHVRETEFKPDWNKYQQGLADGAAAEREACAKVCDEKVDAEYATGKVDHNEMGWTQACAIAIRARRKE